MGKFKRTALLATALCALAGNANADDNLWLGVKAGTLGIGIEGTWRPIDWLDLRLGANQYEYNDSGSFSGINYDGTLELSTYYVTANLRFPLSPFRISVGAYSNNNEVKFVSTDAPAFDIGGSTWTAADVGTLSSETSWDSTSPYLGAGFDFELFGKVGLNFDFGVLWQGDPKVSLSSDGPAAVNQLFMDALENERSELEDDLDALKAYPVMSLGFNFNF